MQPLNTEPYSARLTSSYITPNELIFSRNHDSIVRTKESGLTDQGNSSGWSLTISAEKDEKLSSLNHVNKTLSLEDVKKSHERTEVIATLECAGNRRSELSFSHQPPEGIQWGNAVIANVVWGGASLRSVLLAAGVPDPFEHHSSAQLKNLEPSEQASLSDAAEWARPLHLHMFSAQESTESDDPSRKEYFEASISLPTAMHPNQDCLLAYEYNHQPLTSRHGAPLRAVIPGHVGARWVKWLTGLKISTHENESPPMRQDYKLLVPGGQEKAFADKAENDYEFRKQLLRQQKPLQRLKASSSITQPSHDGEQLEVHNGKISIKGYAVGQDGSPATQVWLAVVPETTQGASNEDLLRSLPADLQWHQAQIHQQHKPDASNTWSWAWTLWQLDVRAPTSKEKLALVARCGKLAEPAFAFNATETNILIQS